MTRQLVLFQDFYRVKPSCVLFASQHYFAKATSADDFDLLEIRDRYISLLCKVDASFQVNVFVQLRKKVSFYYVASLTYLQNEQ